MSDNNGGEYKVGYKHPPKEHQAKPGEVKNPYGPKGKKGSDLRKSGAQKLGEELARWSNKTVRVKKGNKEVRMTQIQVVIERLGQQAMTGDIAAMKVLMALTESSPAPIAFVRPAGKIIFEWSGADEESLRKVTPKQILWAFPDMPDEDMTVMMRYWKMPEGETFNRRDIYAVMHPKEQARLFEKFHLK